MQGKIALSRECPFAKVLSGRGAPGGPELYDVMSGYLSAAREILSRSSDEDDLKAHLIAAFPDFGGRVLLDHQKRFLFPPLRDRNHA
jgi:hypothetical protein